MIAALFLVPAALPGREDPARTADAAAAADTAAADRPLPELVSFLQQVRERLHTDESLLDEYTFTERHIERELDAKGGVKKVKSETYEVYPSPEPGRTYRRLVEKDGKALTSEELVQEDRKHEKKVGDDSPDAAEERRRAEKRALSRRREASAIDQLFQVYDIGMAGRETLDGRSTIVLTFSPRPGVTAAGRAGKILKTFAGRAWIDEEDRQVARVDAELVEPLSFGLGVLARLHKGSRASIIRRKVNGEIWLPAEARFTGSARLLLFKGLRIDATSEYSDYRKFQVATSTDIQPDSTPEKLPEKVPEKHDRPDLDR